MSDVAERMRREDAERSSRMTAGERLEEAWALGDEAIEMYASAHGVDRDEARRILERAAQAGRCPSRVMREIIG